MSNHASQRSESVLQIVICRAKPGITDEQVLRAAEGITPQLLRSPGFVDREIRRTDDGLWVDCLWWKSLDDGERIGAEIHGSPEGQAMFAVMDEAEFTLFNFLSANG